MGDRSESSALTERRAFRRGLMIYGSATAIALALSVASGSDGALAQAIGPRVSPTQAAQGDFTPSPFASPVPAAQFTSRSATRDVVQVNQQAVILNWSTYDSNTVDVDSSHVNFLPSGTELVFNGPGSNYTALNRVFTAANNAGQYRGIAFSGTVSSFLSAGGAVGGNIWFYSPGGILLGNGAAFNVGSLMLTTSNVTAIGGGNGFFFADFEGVTDPFSSVVIDSGASITLTQPGSSLLVFAPTIEQRGTVNVNGGVSYVLGESGSTFFGSSGPSVFVSVEAAPGNRLVHTGTTTGPASPSATDPMAFDFRAIEFLADGPGLETLLSGTVGYAPAAMGAIAENGSIRLVAETLTVGSLNLTSRTDIEASTVNFVAEAGETITMGSDGFGAHDLTIEAETTRFGAEAGGTIAIDGSVLIDKLFDSGTETVTLFARGDSAGVLAPGSVSVGGDLVIDLTAGRVFSATQIGGEITGEVSDGGSLTVGGNLLLLAFAEPTEGEFGTYAQGGVVDFSVSGTDSVLSVGGTLRLDASARQFDPTPRPECDGTCPIPEGGDAVGGSASFTATGGTITTGGFVVDASATAQGERFSGSGQTFNASAGSAAVSIDNASLATGFMELVATARGGNAQVGGTGGDAQGGTVALDLGPGATADIQSLGLYASATGGNGGASGLEEGNGGAGGEAIAGSATLTSATSLDGLSFFDASVSAQGGAGGIANEGAGRSGGVGGNARGGELAILLSGAGNSLGPFVEGGLTASAFGGNGGAGSADNFNFVQGGAGGAGGAAVAGSVSVTAADGGLIDLTGTISAEATGGRGGRGGDTDGEGVSPPGAGGIGGDATGGTIDLLARGGTLTSSIGGDVESFDVNLLANGFGGSGGLTGTDANGGFDFGEGGSGTGGSIAVSTLDSAGLGGVIDFGLTSMEASGFSALFAPVPGQAGQVAIDDGSLDPAGLISFQRLDIFANGSAAIDPAVTIAGASGAISVVEDLYVDTGGDIVMAFAGDGQLAVGGFTTIYSGGSLALDHLDNAAGLASLASGGPIFVSTVGDIVSGPGSIIDSGDRVDLVSRSGSLAIADVRGSTDIRLTAFDDVTLGDATVRGPIADDGAGNVTSGLYIRSGFEEALLLLSFLSDGSSGFSGSGFFGLGGDTTITGTVVSTGNFHVAAGGSAIFAPGSTVLADNAVGVFAQNDILVGSGARVTAGLLPAFSDLSGSSADSHFQAGASLGLGVLDAPPVGSLIVEGTIDTGAAALVLLADAIDATNGAILSGNFLADITDSPAFGGPQGDDGGLLANLCLEGEICIGSLTANGSVEIGSLDDLGVPSVYAVDIDALNVANAANVSILSQGNIELGDPNVAGAVQSGGPIALTSTFGNIDLFAQSLTGDTIALGAANGSLAGTGRLFATGDIGIDVAADLFADTISAGGQLTTVAGIGGTPETSYSVPGAFGVGSFVQGGTTDMVVRAGSISIGSADPGGAAIDLLATDAVFLGTTAADTAAILVSGSDVTFEDWSALGDIAATSTTGGIAPVGAGSILAGGAISLTAATSIDAGTVASTGAGNIALAANDTVSFVSVTNARGGIAIAAANGISGGEVTTASTSDDDSIQLLSDASIALGNATAGDGIAIQAGGSVSGGTIAAAQGGTGSLQIAALGAVALDGFAMGNAGGTASISGQAVSLANGGSSAGAIAIDAGAGGIAAGGNLLAGTTAGLVSGASIAIQGLSTGGAIALRADGGIAFTDVATLAGRIDVTTTGTVTGTSLRTPNQTAADDSIAILAGGAVDLATIAAADGLTISASALRSAQISAGTDIDAAISGLFDVGTLAAGGSLTVQSGVVQLLDGGVGGDASLLTTSGDALIGALDAGGSVAVSSAGDIVVETALSGASGVDLGAAGSVTFASLASANGDIAVTSGAGIGGTSAISGGNVSLSGTAVALDGGSVGGNLIVDATAGSITGSGALAVGGGADLSATGDIALGSLSAQGGNLLASAGGAISFDTAEASGVVSLASDGAITLGSLVGAGAQLTSSGGVVTVASASLSGGLSASGTAVTVTAPGALDASASATAGDVALTAGGDLTARDVVASGNVVLASTGGSVLIEGVSGGTTTLAEGELAPLQVDAQGGSISVSAAQDITVADRVVAANAVTLTAGNLVSVLSSVEGQSIEIVAGDIAIGSGGALGSATRTGSIGIVSSGDLALGGDPGTATGFELDNGELARIFGNGSLSIASTPGGILNLRDADIAVGSQIGANGAVNLSGGIVDVDGALVITGAGTATVLDIAAADSIDFDYEDASLRIEDADGAATGSIELSGREILFLSDAARAAIDGGADPTERLGSGEVQRAEGVLQADTVRLQASERIFVQNTGAGSAIDDRRGIDAGTLVIVGESEGSTLVVVNGRVGGATGSTAAQNAGLEGDFTQGSSFNGCAFGDFATCGIAPPPPPGPPEPPIPPVQDVIEEEVEEESEAEEEIQKSEERSGEMLIDITAIDDPAGAPLIDDPVTGAGNEDLWQPPED